MMGREPGIRRRSVPGPCSDTQFRRRHAIASAKHAVEVGHIPEPGIKRNGADLLAGIACVRQQPVRADKALREDILGEGRALAFEQSRPAWMVAHIMNTRHEYTP